MTLERTISVRGTRQEVVDLLRTIPKFARGSAPIAQTLLVRMGLALLYRVKTAFIVKSRGGTDDTGLRWQPLAPSTIAYKRRHPGVLFPGSRRAPFAPSWMLTQKQRDRWWALYRGFGGIAPQGRGFHAAGGASQGHAAAQAWTILKAEGAKTLIGEYGGAKVDILRDTGLLLNSLSPGVVVGASEPPNPPPIPPNQVFRTTNAEVIVGTNRKFCLSHHRGVPGKIPQRRLWPKPSSWTPRWWSDIRNQGVRGLVDVALYLLGKL